MLKMQSVQRDLGSLVIGTELCNDIPEQPNNHVHASYFAVVSVITRSRFTQLLIRCILASATKLQQEN